MNPRTKQPKKWNRHDNVRSFDEGWGLFDCDSGRLRIMRLDDPPAARPEKCNCREPFTFSVPCRWCLKAGFTKTPSDSPFESDADALDFVMEQAAFRGGYHRKAIALAAGFR